jgi:hypothetical protein
MSLAGTVLKGTTMAFVKIYLGWWKLMVTNLAERECLDGGVVPL